MSIIRKAETISFTATSIRNCWAWNYLS